MSIPLKQLYSNSMSPTPVRAFLNGGVAGDMTADTSFVFIAPFDGRFTNINQAFMNVGNCGTDGSNPLNVALEVAIDGTSIFATQPSVDKTADDGSNTLTAVSSKVVAGALSSTASELEFTKGQEIKVTLDITRTASPADEMADIAFCVILQELADYDIDITVVRPTS